MKRLTTGTGICLVCSLLLMTAATGCTGNLPEEQNGQEQLLSIRSCSDRAASSNTSFTQDFGLALYSSGSADGYPQVNNPVKVTYSTSWMLPDIALTDENCDIYAFFPFVQSVTDHQLQLDNTTQTDYLATAGPIVANKFNYAVDIVLQHLLSKIQFSVNGDTGCKVKMLDCPSKGTYDLINGTLTVGQEKAEVTAGNNRIYLFPANNKNYSCSIEFNGKTYSYVTNIAALEKGKEYTVSLRIDDSKNLILDEVTVADWISGGRYEGTIRE